MQDPTAAPILEVCVDDAAGLAAAIAGGADRVELCAALPLGGLTPAPGLTALASRADIPICAMIRPRAGGFVYDREDIKAAILDIAAIRAAGLAGIVTGATHPDGQLDIATLSRLRDAAGGMDLVIHRAFDLAPDLDEALEQAVALGARRILTSGGAASAPEGAERLAGLTRLAGDRIGIVAGGGVRPENVPLLLRSGVRELHGSFSSILTDQPMTTTIGIAASRPRTLAENVRAMRDAMRNALEKTT